MAVYGDSRSNPAVHRQIAQRILEAKVDLMVHTGDIVLNGTIHDSWRREFFEPLGALGHSVPWVSTIGNHERDSANYFSYMALPGNERYFGFDYANAHIVCLDSNGWIERGRDSKEFEWMSRHLHEQRTATWTFVAFHHPLFSAHATRPINTLRWDWTPLFLDPASRVDAVLTGHDHFYARNYPLSRITAEAPQGVLFMTTAGGGANLYRCKDRDYVAFDKSVHHFTLFDVDGDTITISAIDLAGRVFDRYTMTKRTPPPNELCAYEVEEIRRFLRLALAAAPPVPTSPGEAVDTSLTVPTRFDVPVSGQLQWEEVPHWKMHGHRDSFHLDRHQPLKIPLQAEVGARSFQSTPRLNITFDPGKFRNRTIQLYPFKLAGPKVVSIRAAATAPKIDGDLECGVWSKAASYPLLAQHPQGGRADRVRLLADKDWLYVGAQLDNAPEGPGMGRLIDSVGPARAALLEEHFRLDIRDAQHARTFALCSDNLRHCACDRVQDQATCWHSAATASDGGWSVEMAIPRSLFVDLSKLALNAIHHRRVNGKYVDYALCPSYELGNDPDVIPDWKTAGTAELFARPVLEN
jgi:hypothetical protein